MMRRAAANKAVRAALGGDDLTTKWKLMSKKSQQKEDTRTGATLHAQPSEKMIVVSQTSRTRIGDRQESQRKGTSKFMKNKMLV